jgi:hypothetical protein
MAKEAEVPTLFDRRGLANNNEIQTVFPLFELWFFGAFQSRWVLVSNTT